MCDVTYSVEMVRSFFDHAPDRREAAKARVAFEVVMEAHGVMIDMLHAAIDRQHDAEVALSALRHPSDSVEALKATLRKMARMEVKGEPMSPAFEQVLDELIAEVKLECATPLVGTVERTR
jgi:hypothetical protein